MIPIIINIFAIAVLWKIAAYAYKEIKIVNKNSAAEARAHRLIMERRDIDRMKPSDKQIMALKVWKDKVAMYVADYESSETPDEKFERLKMIVNNDN